MSILVDFEYIRAEGGPPKNVNPRIRAFGWTWELKQNFSLVCYVHLGQQNAALFLVPFSSWLPGVHRNYVFLQVHASSTGIVAVRTSNALFLHMHEHMAIKDILQRSAEAAYGARQLSSVVYPPMHIPFRNRSEPLAADATRDLFLARVSQCVAREV